MSEARKLWLQSDKGKEYLAKQKEYQKTDEYKKKKKQWMQSTKGKACLKKSKAKWYHVNGGREHQKLNSYRLLLKRNYNLTLEQYNIMLKNQSGLCVICGKPELFKINGKDVARLSVDHNHKNGQIRELLCGSCNTGLGCFKDNPILLRNGANYLEKHGAISLKH